MVTNSLSQGRAGGNLRRRMPAAGPAQTCNKPLPANELQQRVWGICGVPPTASSKPQFFAPSALRGESVRPQIQHSIVETIMNDSQEAILKAVHGELAAVLAKGRPESAGGYASSDTLAWKSAQWGAVTAKPAKWLGHPLDAAEAKQFSRDCIALEAAGLLERVPCRRNYRTPLLRLTDAGIIYVTTLMQGVAVDA